MDRININIHIYIQPFPVSTFLLFLQGGGISSKGFSVVGRGLVGVGGVGSSWVGLQLETLKFCLTTFNKDF